MKKKHFYCILLCLAGALTTSNYVKAQVCTVRLTVELPGSGIQEDSTVFIAGTFNNWNPSDSSCYMKRIDSKHYTIEVPCFMNKKYSYKYTLGSWNSVEKETDGKDIKNRTFTASKKLKIMDKIAKWNKPAPAATRDTAHLLSKKQMEVIKSLNDSVSKSLPAVLPRLFELLQKINTNLLADEPDDLLNKQYNKEAGEIISKILDSLGGVMKQMVSTLTAEQKQKIREVMKDPNAPKDIINLIGKLSPDSK